MRAALYAKRGLTPFALLAVSLFIFSTPLFAVSLRETENSLAASPGADGTYDPQGGSLEEHGEVILLQSILGRHGGVAIAAEHAAAAKPTPANRGVGSLDPAGEEILTEVAELFAEEILRRGTQTKSLAADTGQSSLLLHGGLGLIQEKIIHRPTSILRRGVGSLDAEVPEIWDSPVPGGV